MRIRPQRGNAEPAKDRLTMPIDFDPHHRHLDFMSPLSEARADRLAAFMAAHARGTVLDIGCGWARLLVKVLAANGHLRGIGIDLDSSGFEHARELADSSGVASHLELRAGDAKDLLPSQAQGAICIGASQVWGPPVEANLPLDYSSALIALRRLVEPGAPVIYGEGIWSDAPTIAASAPLAGRLDEFLRLPDLVELAWERGFAVVRVHEATQDEWDRFECGYAARYATWLATHSAQHPDAAEVSAKARRQRDAYFRGYRGVLGMAYLELLAM
jgi:hypothetical protein